MTALRLQWPRDPRFSVTENGDIYGPSGRKLRPILQRGRAGISVHKDGHWQRVMISVIVCETFHGPRPDPKMHAAHENGDGLDNRACNLSWKTATENEADKLRHGTRMRGERHHQAKLTERDVYEIRAFRATGTWRLREIGAMYGVSESQVSAIVHRKVWSHI